MLEHLWLQEHVRGPFLVVAPLSTLTHWQREITDWTELQVLLYHGSRESRALMLRHEFWMDAPEAASTKSARAGRHLKFHVLLTSCNRRATAIDRYTT